MLRVVELTVHTGGCLCGAIRYEIDGPLPPPSHCHCSICRKSSGAVAMTWISVPRQRFRFIAGKPKVFRSSDEAERTFCPTCGSLLTFYTVLTPEDVDVSLGSLDDPESHPADRHVFADDALSWLSLDEHLPEYAAWTPSGHGVTKS